MTPRFRSTKHRLTCEESIARSYAVDSTGLETDACRKRFSLPDGPAVINFVADGLSGEGIMRSVVSV